MKRILFLDLEDTIITPITASWQKFDLINVDKIKRFIKKHKIVEVNIFSFAIHDQRQLQQFNKFCRPVIEEALGQKFFMVPTVDSHIIPSCCRVMGLTQSTVNFEDACAFWGKQLSFELFINDTRKPLFLEQIFFLDDAVINKTFSFPKIFGSTLNIDSIY